ncbi:hypothetical protein OH76DRAFT_1400587 [Lentinus brumalis]|uniref:MFS general substrate transporter n=1 Tax=Lentinus brumalis TaxID=2498619 RepID=A0A371DI80_9APHY|nr:hypothetical protein OH76DRAFT_1400587 [Polyporus brumalis]
MTSAWISNNVAGQYKRAVAIAIQVIFGNSGGAIASNAYRIMDAPRYLLGHGIEIMFVGMGLVLLPLTVVTYWRINIRRERRQQEAEEKGVKLSPEALRKLGDRAPDFRYML